MESIEHIQLPIPIFRVAQRYYVYDLKHATYLRAQHRIPGVLSGTLPQSPQQNVFFGLPVQLLSEEARLLVEQNVCIVVDDQRAHSNGIRELASNASEKQKWLDILHGLGSRAAQGRQESSNLKREAALDKMTDDKKKAALRSLEKRKNKSSTSSSSTASHGNAAALRYEPDDDDQLFPAYEIAMSPPSPHTPAVAQASSPASTIASQQPEQSARDSMVVHHVTPTTSYPPLEWHLPNDSEPLPEAPDSYPLFRYLHTDYPSSNYFLSPGLRFGCQYVVYPGDPLRFHSHFLAVSRGWDEEIDLLALLGGGRLGTGVKKGFLIGGVEGGNEANNTDGRGRPERNVRCFSIEWGGM